MLPFGETILAWRLARGLTQAQLARAARVPRPNLSAIERGARDVTLRTLRALAVALDVSPGTLADGISPHQGPSPSHRVGLERIAAAALEGNALSDPREARLASHLGAVMGVGPAGARRGRRQRAARATERAYFLLRTSASAETIASLVSRVSERRRRR
jgi:transcriptional regulator with XRE-family HTH domain